VSFFDEMHIFCTVASQWQQVLFSQEAPKLAGHTASLLKENKMVLFGGCNGSLGKDLQLERVLYIFYRGCLFFLIYDTRPLFFVLSSQEIPTSGHRKKFRILFHGKGRHSRVF